MVYTRRVYSSPFYIKTILKHIYSNNPRTLTELPGRKTQRSGQHADCSSWSHTPNTKHIVPSSQVAPRRTKLCFSVCFSIPPRCTPGIQSNTPKAPSHEQGWLWSSCSAQYLANPWNLPYGIETAYLSLLPNKTLNSSKMVMKLYWSFEHSFYDPDRNILAALKKKKKISFSRIR